jgi:hypothetical protein
MKTFTVTFKVTIDDSSFDDAALSLMVFNIRDLMKNVIAPTLQIKIVDGSFSVRGARK